MLEPRIIPSIWDDPKITQRDIDLLTGFSDEALYLMPDRAKEFILQTRERVAEYGLETYFTDRQRGYLESLWTKHGDISWSTE